MQVITTPCRSVASNLDSVSEKQNNLNVNGGGKFGDAAKTT